MLSLSSELKASLNHPIKAGKMTTMLCVTRCVLPLRLVARHLEICRTFHPHLTLARVTPQKIYTANQLCKGWKMNFSRKPSTRKIALTRKFSVTSKKWRFSPMSLRRIMIIAKGTNRALWWCLLIQSLVDYPTIQRCFRAEVFKITKKLGFARLITSSLI